ncbi:hypothetical protein [Gordonia sp. YY1]|uniref:hypothetical protein n=1 Tax=Gordonia sp. YY1 TaxID=396712 RepID=UPI001331454F|nr:hypothetical protein [Gordonia sp. YY1]KAF0967822.1 hypothetical protein BPODLACK_03777 [Gordonia sp. YY1]
MSDDDSIEVRRARVSAATQALVNAAVNASSDEDHALLVGLEAGDLTRDELVMVLADMSGVLNRVVRESGWKGDN